MDPSRSVARTRPHAGERTPSCGHLALDLTFLCRMRRRSGLRSPRMASMSLGIGLGARTTAVQALRGISLAGRTAIVTGASSGLGIETARVLALAGASVVMACRSVEAGERTKAELLRALPSASLRVCALDLADFTSVRAFAEAFRIAGEPLHILVNNAGIMAPPLALTPQGMESQMGTNHVGHFLLTKLLLPALAPGARVVNVSSGLHTRGRRDSLLATLEDDPKYEKRRYVPFDAYGDSKLANVLFTSALAPRLSAGAMAFSLHPGVIATNLSRSLGIGGALFRIGARLFSKDVPQGCATTIVAATAPELEGRTGAYLSDCDIATPSRDAQDRALAERVWEISETIVA